MRQDAFLPIYLIAIITFTIGSNAILLLTFYKVKAMKVYIFEKVLCLIGLAALFCVQTPMLVGMAVKNSLQNEVFCEITGTLIAFMQRVSIFHICVLSVERYYNLIFPMKMLTVHVERLLSFALFAVAITVSSVPIFVHLIHQHAAYIVLKNIPICVPIYEEQARPFLYVDLVLSFLIPSVIILLVTLGVSVLKQPVRTDSKYDQENTSIYSVGSFSRVSMIIRKKVARQRKKIPKAFVVLPITLLLVILLNFPLAYIMLQAKAKEHQLTTPENIWIVEYLAFIGVVTTYLVFPVVNGLTNRDIRQNTIRILRNTISNHHLDNVRVEQEPTVKINTISSRRRLLVRIVEIEEEEDYVTTVSNHENGKVIFTKKHSSCSNPSLDASNQDKNLVNGFQIRTNHSDSQSRNLCDPFYVKERSVTEFDL